MTNGEDRLDRVERILEENAQALRETRAIADSNARSIQAWENRIDENRQAAQAAQAELNRRISDLNSTVATLADIVGVHEQQHQDSMRRHDELMQLHQDSMRRHEESRQRHEESEQRAEADRALMLQLIQAIAQGRNGG